LDSLPHKFIRGILHAILEVGPEASINPIDNKWAAFPVIMNRALKEA
jgi:hypothetical protein